MSIKNYLNSVTPTAITSIFGALVGSVTPGEIDVINIVLQRGAWTIAILAGIISGVNGIYKIIYNKNQKYEKENMDYSNRDRRYRDR